MKEYLVEIASVPDRDFLVAEIWYGEVLVAEINQEKEDLEIEFYLKDSLKFNYKAFCNVLLEAERKLRSSS
ncbi:MAG: hypothetical protein MI739_09570 [Bacteroidales bacterium]|nr:hypothetical protein [Bacteroidales bacterium]